MPEREVPIKPTMKKHGTFWHTANFLEHLFGTLPKNFLEFSICKRENYFFSVLLLHANILLEGAARAPRVSSYSIIQRWAHVDGWG